jgi:hypothetical protein
MSDDKKTITYIFDFGSFKREIAIDLKLPLLELMSHRKKPLLPWTKLKFHQCPNCPLDEIVHPYCPVAVNLSDVIEEFNEYFSIQEVMVSIITEYREFRKSVSLQKGLSSLFGIIMATSGCPILDKLRPMVYTHLPFATSEETTYRTVSMYLLAQYFIYKRGKFPDWELNNLITICEDIKMVNKSFSYRIRSIQKKDANINSLITLDCLAALTEISISHNKLKELEFLFYPYL